jgi:hypothetical protein
MCMQAIDVELDRGGKHEAGLLSRPELEQMITWETNNLYEYLKELYDHKQQDMVDNRSVPLPSHTPQFAVTKRAIPVLTCAAVCMTAHAACSCTLVACETARTVQLTHLTLL